MNIVVLLEENFYEWLDLWMVYIKITLNNIIDFIDGYTDVIIYVNEKMIEKGFRTYSFPVRYDLQDYSVCEVKEIQAVGERKIALYIKGK